MKRIVTTLIIGCVLTFRASFVSAQTAAAARPAGAVLEGRIVQDGQPVQGISVEAVTGQEPRRRSVSAVSDATGHYRFTGLAAGTYFVHADAPPQIDRVIPPIENIVLEEAFILSGKTRTLPDLLFDTGAFIEGRVLDSQSGKPLPATALTYRSTYLTKRTQSDDNGHYRLCVLPGAGAITMEQSNNYEQGWQDAGSVARGATLSLDLKQVAFKEIDGIARDEAGKPVGGLKLNFTQSNTGRFFTATTGPDGRFHIRLAADKVRFQPEATWKIISPLFLDLPTREPVIVTVARVASAPLHGRVIDDSGQPVKDAAVKIDTVYLDVGANVRRQETQNLITDAGGKYELAALRIDMEIKLEVRKDGYLIRRRPSVTIEHDILGINGIPVPNPKAVFQVADTIAIALTHTLFGRVVDEKGAPVADAYIAALMSEQQTRSAPDGTWKLSRTALSDFIIAATDERFGQGQVAATKLGSQAANPSLSTDIVITPQQRTPVDAARAKALLEDILQHRPYDYWHAMAVAPLARDDWEGALAFARKPRGDEPAGPVTLAYVLLALAEAQPERARRELPTLLDGVQLSDGLEVFYALQIADYAPAWARAALERSRVALQSPAKGTVTTTEIMTRMALAALAAKLGAPDAVKLAQEPVRLADDYRKATESGHYEYEMLGTLAALAGPGFFQQILPSIPRDRQAPFFGGGICIAARNDLPTAQRWMAAFIKVPAPEDDRGGFKQQHEKYFGLAALAVIRRLRTKDAEASLILARQVYGPYQGAMALALVAAVLPPEKASAVWREAMEASANSWYSANIAFVASLAAQKDPELGRTFFAQAESQALGKPANAWRAENIASLATHLIPYRPGYARWLLERDYALRYTEYSYTNYESVSTAMMMLDVHRSIEMARDMARRPAPDAIEGYVTDYRMVLRAQRNAARYLLTPEADRLDKPYYYWSSSGRSGWWLPAPEDEQTRYD